MKRWQKHRRRPYANFRLYRWNNSYVIKGAMSKAVQEFAKAVMRNALADAMEMILNPRPSAFGGIDRDYPYYGEPIPKDGHE